jgi:cytochrome P450
MLARDPLKVLRRLRDEYGPVFTVRSANGPMVVVGAAEEVARVTELDPGGARAGEARRRVLPQASPRSVFGGDDEAHRAASGRVREALSLEAIARVEPQIAALAERRAAAWPTGRPFQLRVRMRDLAAETFVRFVLRPSGEDRAVALTRAARHLLRTPGNPPFPPPAAGLLAPTTARLLERRLAPFARLVREEIEERRAHGAADGGGVLASYAASGLEPQAAVDELTIVAAAATDAGGSGLTAVLEQLLHEPAVASQVARTGAADPLFGPAVDESLRLRPVAMAAMRRLTRPLAIAGHELPAAAVLMAPGLLLQRDPGTYEEPDAFRVDRFADGPYGPYFPFGGGARGCIGLHLAQAEIRAVVPVVLRTRRLRPLARQPERLVERATILSPGRGALVVAS